MVIDRVRVRADARQRLAESLETALRHADGKAVVVEADTKKEHLSRALRVPGCDYRCPSSSRGSFRSTTRWAPARAATARLRGVLRSPKRIVAHPNLSLASGAIRGWDRRNHFYYSMLQSLAKHYRFDIESPWEMLDERIQKLILYGSGKEKIAFQYLSERSRTSRKEHPFEGVIPNHERRYRETDSLVVREELAKLRNLRVSGVRRRAAAPRSAARPRGREDAAPGLGLAAQADAAVLHAAQPEGRQGRGRRSHRARNREPPRVPVNVGLDYLTLERGADTLSGGEGQRIRLASQIGSGLTGVMYVLDEPSIGLHQRDNARLITTLKQLRDLGKPVIVVEHDEEAIRAADHVLDMGPGAGAGGCIVAQGTPAGGHRQSGLANRALSFARPGIAVPPRRKRSRKTSCCRARAATT